LAPLASSGGVLSRPGTTNLLHSVNIQFESIGVTLRDELSLARGATRLSSALLQTRSISALYYLVAAGTVAPSQPLSTAA
jgi:hypothetical protein